MFSIPSYLLTIEVRQVDNIIYVPTWRKIVPAKKIRVILERLHDSSLHSNEVFNEVCT